MYASIAEMHAAAAAEQSCIQEQRAQHSARAEANAAALLLVRGLPHETGCAAGMCWSLID